MKRRWIVYTVVNILQLSAVLAGWSTLHDPAHARAGEGWRWPLAGQAVVDRPFQPPTTRWGAGHRGVDLRGAEGQQVLSAGDGTITYSGLLAGRGVVVVTHLDGLRTTYEPVVGGPRVGTKVGAGDPIGRLAQGHASCRVGTSCLHWGLRRGETYLDPLRLVLGGRLRLLPVAPAEESVTSHRPASAPPALHAEARSTEDPLATARPVQTVGVKRLFYNMAVNMVLLAAFAFALARGVWRLVRWARRRRARAA